VRITLCTSAELLILIRVLRPLDIQRSYRARKSADEAGEAEVAAGGDGLRRGPVRTTSAQDGEFDPFPVAF
jgi:hypothetical protein